MNTFKTNIQSNEEIKTHKETCSPNNSNYKCELQHVNCIT